MLKLRESFTHVTRHHFLFFSSLFLSFLILLLLSLTHKNHNIHHNPGSLASKIICGHSWTSSKVKGVNLSKTLRAHDIKVLPPLPHTSVFRRAMFGLGAYSSENADRLRRVYDLKWSNALSLEVVHYNALLSRESRSLEEIRESICTELWKRNKDFVDEKKSCNFCFSNRIIMFAEVKEPTKRYHVTLSEYGDTLKEFSFDNSLCDMFQVTTMKHGLANVQRTYGFRDRDETISSIKNCNKLSRKSVIAFPVQRKNVASHSKQRREMWSEMRFKSLDFKKRALQDLIARTTKMCDIYKNITVDSISALKLIERAESKRFKSLPKKIRDVVVKSDDENIYMVSLRDDNKSESKGDKETRVNGYFDAIIKARESDGMFQSLRFIGTSCRDGHVLVSGKRTKKKKKKDVEAMVSLLQTQDFTVAIACIGGGPSYLLSDKKFHAWLCEMKKTTEKNLKIDSYVHVFSLSLHFA